MTSAIPAEVMAGGVSINMVTKDGGNKWRGNMRYSFANDDLQSENHLGRRSAVPAERRADELPRQPDAEDLRRQPVGRRRARPEQAVGQRHDPALGREQAHQREERRRHAGARRQHAEELLGQGGRVVHAATTGCRCRTSGTTRFAAIAATRRRTTSPTSPRSCRPTRRRRRRRSTPASATGWCSSRTSASWTARPTTATSPARRPTPSASRTARCRRRTSPRRRNEEQPNSRHQFDNIVSYSKSALAASTCFKGGVQWARLYYESRYTVQGDHHLIYNNGSPDRGAHLQHAGESEEHRPHARVLLPGCVVDRQPADAQPRHALRQEHAASCRSSPTRAARSSPRAASRSRSRVNQSIAVWRAGAVVRPDRQRPHRAEGAATAATGCRSASTA